MEASYQSRVFVSELTGKKRNRLFAYAPYIAILSEGAEPLRF